MLLKKKSYDEHNTDNTSIGSGVSYGSNMAENARDVRIEEQLRVKIGEAKHLCSRNAANTSCSAQGTRDAYCTVTLDQEEICRTPTVERQLSPFFGEEYHFKIPRRFRYFCIYVWDRDRHSKQDKAIGKIAIKREELHMYNQNEHWFPLRPVDQDSEVQGMAHIEMRFEELPSSGQQSTTTTTATVLPVKHEQQSTPRINLLHPREFGSGSGSGSIGSAGSLGLGLTDQHQQQALQNDYKENSELSKIQRHASKSNRLLTAGSEQPTVAGSNPLMLGKNARLAVRVTECVDLATKNGACDPYIVFTAHYSNKRQVTKRTKLRKKTTNPEFDEVVHFELCLDQDAANNAAATAAASKSPQVSGKRYALQHQQQLQQSAIGSSADLCEVCVTVWHDVAGSIGISDKVFLGEVRLRLDSNPQQLAIQPAAWYYLQPRNTSAAIAPQQLSAASQQKSPPGTRLSIDNSIGSLRINLHYTADHVFPLPTYDDLLNLLIESIDERPITHSAVSIIGELVQCKTEIAQPLARLFTYTERLAPIIKQLADHEISTLTDPTTIFRGNTLVSKMMDQAMRLNGFHYLRQTLRPVLTQILSDRKNCEIDPTRAKDRSSVDASTQTLIEYVERTLNAIINSADRCPRLMCQLFSDMREIVSRHFPNNQEVRYSVISGFIFLRFFAPAILGPKLFGLTTEKMDPQMYRTLTLISKTIQALGNLVGSRSAQHIKEEYVGVLYRKFQTEHYKISVKIFLDAISTTTWKDSMDVDDDDVDVMEDMHDSSMGTLRSVAQTEPVLLKEGTLINLSETRKRFGRNQSKQRYFRLSTHSLSYAKSKDKQTICDIPLKNISGIEQLYDGSFKMQYCFKILHGDDEQLIVQAPNCVEERDWIDLLHKISRTNAIRMQSFHPSAFVNGIYSCCARSDENAPGCRNVSAKQMRYYEMDLVTALDPPLDLQRIHTFIMAHMESLDALLDPIAIYQFKSKKFHNEHTPLMTLAYNLLQQSTQAYKEFASKIEKIRAVAYAIDRDHRNYKQGIARELVYGSKHAPIGDDNYLKMMHDAGQQQTPPQQQPQQMSVTLPAQPAQQQQPQQILPHMQKVVAYPYHHQQQYQQQQQQKVMNAYLMYNLQRQQQQQQVVDHHQQQHQHQHQHQQLFQQQQVQQQQQQQQQQHQRQYNNALRAAASVQRQLNPHQSYHPSRLHAVNLVGGVGGVSLGKNIASSGSSTTSSSSSSATSAVAANATATATKAASRPATAIY